MKVSIIIPNYNGEGLLEKNLPHVLKNSPGCEIIIVDDGSEDKSVEILHDNFPQIKLITLKRNKGFATAANCGVEEAKGDLVVLLNTDVVPQRDFLKNSIKHFVDSRVFAVSFADLSHEDSDIIIRGRGAGEFEKGFLIHWKASSKKGDSLWASGGSSIFRKKIWQKLGGLDELYDPFYWEDIDLSFRAWCSGYKVVFEPKAMVDHYHQKGVISTKFSKSRIKTISYRNQFIFVWKNICDSRFIFQHFLWLPYHSAKAFSNFDWAFIFGFFQAFAKLPKVIARSILIKNNYALSDREVLEKFKNVS